MPSTKGHYFGLVDIVGRQLAQMHLLLEQLGGNLAQIVDFGHCHHGISAQMRVDNDGLRVGVTDYSEALVAGKAVELVLKF